MDDNCAVISSPGLGEPGAQSIRPLHDDFTGEPHQAWESLRMARWGVSKRLVDLNLSLLLIALLAPLLLITTLLVSCSGGPVFFAQQRIGRNNRPFPCYKFRTMVPNAAAVLEELLRTDPVARAEWEKNHKLRHDPRVTRIGQFLRRTSLDELPQILNVLRGEMSLIGPRPITQAEMVRYGKAARYYCSVRPGITGLWQVSGRNDTSYTTRVALDIVYVRHLGPSLDVRILLRTIVVLLQQRGAY